MTKSQQLWRAGCLAASAFAFSATVALSDESGPPDSVTNWMFQPCFDQTDAGWANGIVPWIDAVEEATEGSVQIRLEPAGALIDGGEAFGATIAGALDVTACWATVYGGDMPEGMLAFGMAMGAETTEQAWDVMWGNPDYRIGDLVQEAAMSRNLYWAGWSNQGPNAMFTKFRVDSLDDLAGRPMRAGGPQAIFHSTMGGSPVAMGAGDIYTAIRLGTVEGTYWDTGGINDMSFHEVVDYAIMPGWNPAQHQEIFINLDAWNALTDWQRAQIDGVFEEVYFRTSEMHAEGVEQALQDLVDAGGEVIHLSDEEVARMRTVSISDVWPQVAAQSELTARGVELWTEYLRDIGLY